MPFSDYQIGYGLGIYTAEGIHLRYIEPRLMEWDRGSRKTEQQAYRYGQMMRQVTDNAAVPTRDVPMVDSGLEAIAAVFQEEIGIPSLSEILERLPDFDLDNFINGFEHIYSNLSDISDLLNIGDIPIPNLDIPTISKKLKEGFAKGFFDRTERNTRRIQKVLGKSTARSALNTARNFVRGFFGGSELPKPGDTVRASGHGYRGDEPRNIFGRFLRPDGTIIAAADPKIGTIASRDGEVDAAIRISENERNFEGVGRMSGSREMSLVEAIDKVKPGHSFRITNVSGDGRGTVSSSNLGSVLTNSDDERSLLDSESSQAESVSRPPSPIGNSPTTTTSSSSSSSSSSNEPSQSASVSRPPSLADSSLTTTTSSSSSSSLTSDRHLQLPPPVGSSPTTTTSSSSSSSSSSNEPSQAASVSRPPSTEVGDEASSLHHMPPLGSSSLPGGVGPQSEGQSIASSGNRSSGNLNTSGVGSSMPQQPSRLSQARESLAGIFSRMMNRFREDGYHNLEMGEFTSMLEDEFLAQRTIPRSVSTPPPTEADSRGQGAKSEGSMDKKFMSLMGFQMGAESLNNAMNQIKSEEALVTQNRMEARQRGEMEERQNAQDDQNRYNEGLQWLQMRRGSRRF